MILGNALKSLTSMSNSLLDIFLMQFQKKSKIQTFTKKQRRYSIHYVPLMSSQTYR